MRPRMDSNRNSFITPFLAVIILTIFIISVVQANDNQSQSGEYITINPIGDHFIGDKIVMNGSVNIFDAKQLGIRVSPSWKGHPAAPRFDTKIDFAMATIDFQNNLWSYTLDTVGDWIPDEYVVEVTPAEPNATLEADTRFNLSERTSPTFTPPKGYWVSVDPIGTHFIGDSFTVSGETNFPIGQEFPFLAQVANMGPGNPTLRPPSETGSTLVTAGTGEVHNWSFVIDTTKFTRDNGVQSEAIAGDYILTVGPFGQDIYHFTLLNRTQIYRGSPTLNSPVSLATTVASKPTTPQKTPPSILVPIIAIGIFVSFAMSRKK